MGKLKQAKRKAIQERLLLLFDKDEYSVFDADKYIFVKQWNGNTKQWQVAIYTKASWDNSQNFLKKAKQKGIDKLNHLDV